MCRRHGLCDSSVCDLRLDRIFGQYHSTHTMHFRIWFIAKMIRRSVCDHVRDLFLLCFVFNIHTQTHADHASEVDGSWDRVNQPIYYRDEIIIESIFWPQLHLISVFLCGMQIKSNDFTETTKLNDFLGAECQWHCHTHSLRLWFSVIVCILSYFCFVLAPQRWRIHWKFKWRRVITNKHSLNAFAHSLHFVRSPRSLVRWQKNTKRKQ